MRKLLHILVLLSLALAPMSYGIAALEDAVNNIQDCEHSMHQGGSATQQQADSKCCCDTSCDGCCASGFHAASAIVNDVPETPVSYLKRVYFDTGYHITGLMPTTNFRPPINLS